MSIALASGAGCDLGDLRRSVLPGADALRRCGRLHTWRPCTIRVDSACTLAWQPRGPQPPTVTTASPISAPDVTSTDGGTSPAVVGRSQTHGLGSMSSWKASSVAGRATSLFTKARKTTEEEMLLPDVLSVPKP